MDAVGAMVGAFRGAGWRQALPTAGSILLGLMFVATALLKAASPDETREALAWAFGSWASAVGLEALVLGELALGAALLCWPGRLLPLVFAALALIAFGAWRAALALLDAPVECGCGSVVIWGFDTEGITSSLWTWAAAFAVSSISLAAFVSGFLKERTV